MSKQPKTFSDRVLFFITGLILIYFCKFIPFLWLKSNQAHTSTIANLYMMGLLLCVGVIIIGIRCIIETFKKQWL